jgi:predicted small secreted protein
MIKKFTLAVLVVGTLIVSACNTVKGLGRDIQSVGNAGSDAIH